MFDTKKELMWSKLKVGLVVTIAFLVLLVTVFFAGGIESLFTQRRRSGLPFSMSGDCVSGRRSGFPALRSERSRA